MQGRRVTGPPAAETESVSGPPDGIYQEPCRVVWFISNKNIKHQGSQEFFKTPRFVRRLRVPLLGQILLSIRSSVNAKL